MIGLNALNVVGREAFVAALSGIFEHSSWVPAAIFADRPFPTIAALHAAMVDTVRNAGLERKLSLLKAHPELAAKSDRRVALTAESTSEQASVGLDTMEGDEAVRLSAANWLYRQRFGFPFIIAVRGQRDRAAILTAIERRTANSETEEIETAINEVAKIAWFRLSDLVKE
jgi:2-oxo-4-hydroxy-4-carboxy-5-ureidoimidazoline decarboxylase